MPVAQLCIFEIVISHQILVGSRLKVDVPSASIFHVLTHGIFVHTQCREAFCLSCFQKFSGNILS